MDQRIVICIDAMNTIFVPTHGRWELYVHLFHDLLGRDADPKEVERVYKLTRRQVEQTESKNTKKLSKGFYRRYWGEINAAMIAHLFPDPNRDNQSIGESIAVEVLGNPQYYSVPAHVFQFLHEARKQKQEVYVLSNHELVALEGLMTAFSLQDYINGCIVSDEIGYKKPDKQFFVEALRIMRVSASSIRYIGNNPRNDMEGAHSAGIRKLFLFDPRGEHGDTPSSVAFTRISDLNDIFANEETWG